MLVWCPKIGAECGYFGGFFHQINMYQRIGRTDSIQAASRRIRRLEAFLYIEAQNYKLLSKIQNQNLKIYKFKTYCGQPPILGLTNGTTLS
jgi:hypothetical protein